MGKGKKIRPLRGRHGESVLSNTADTSFSEDSSLAKSQASSGRRKSQSKSLKILQQVISTSGNTVSNEIMARMVVEKLRSKDKRFYLNPKWPSMKRWDLLMVFFLIFTAAFTPYEVAFLETNTLDPLFIFNRLVDAAFTLDVVVNFHLGIKHPITGRNVTDLYTIRLLYLKGWFPIDLLSILPFDTISFILQSYVPAMASNLASFKVLRIIRLFRLVKLLKILQASRIISRWQSRVGISFATLSMIKFSVGTCILAHWVACAFRFLTLFMSPKPYESWMVAYGVQDDSPSQLYVTSLYWSITTLTTVGYGDVTPQSMEERIFCIFSMVLGGIFYAYVIGGICGIVASMDEVGNLYRSMMDNLNLYMDEVKLPFARRMELREYFMYCKSLHRDRHYKHVLEQMSPGLQAKFASHCHGDWIQNVYFFRLKDPNCKSDASFAYQIALALEPAAFPPSEAIIQTGELTIKMYIINRGLCARLGCVLGSGRFFGEDMILNQAVRSYCVMSMTFVGVYVLEKSSLQSILGTGLFPKRNKLVRRAAIRLALIREFVRVANDAKKKPKTELEKLLELKRYGGVGWVPVAHEEVTREPYEFVQPHNMRDNRRHDNAVQDKGIRRRNNKKSRKAKSNAWSSSPKGRGGKQQNRSRKGSRKGKALDGSISQASPASDFGNDLVWQQRHEALVYSLADLVEPLQQQLVQNMKRVDRLEEKLSAAFPFLVDVNHNKKDKGSRSAQKRRNFGRGAKSTTQNMDVHRPPQAQGRQQTSEIMPGPASSVAAAAAATADAALDAESVGSGERHRFARTKRFLKFLHKRHQSNFQQFQGTDVEERRSDVWDAGASV